jgi:hypothetical protein
LQAESLRGTINPTTAAQGRGVGPRRRPTHFTQAGEGKRIMSKRFLLLLLAAGLGTGWASADDTKAKRQSAQQVVAEQAARLVAELGSDDFETRERAARQLETLGPAVVPALRKATTSPDPEVRRLAVQVAERLARKMEAAEVLEPKRFRLAFRDMPLNFAVQEFTRVTGARLQLDGVKGDRKVTLDTQYTNFWDAFDKFCAAAGLVEKVFDSPGGEGSEGPMQYPYGRRRMVMWNGRWAPQQDDILPALQNGQFVLTEGKPTPRPTCQAGGLRFRALPGGTKLGKLSTVKGDKELIFGLEILPEPSLAWEKVQSLHITRVVDDQGQTLDASQMTAGPEAPVNEFEDFVYYGGPYDGNGGNNGGQRVPLRLTLGRKPSAAIKELSGVATIKLQTSTQTIATIDRILEAKDKAAKGSDGSFLKVIEVKQEGGGKLVIHIKVEQAQDEDAGAFNPWGWRGGMVYRGMNGGENVDSSVSTGNLVLFDARGNLVRLVSKEQVPDENGNEEYRFTYQVAKGQPEPSKFVLQGRRPVSIDVPFTLKDVPLRALPGAPKPVKAPAPQSGLPEPPGIAIEK